MTGPDLDFISIIPAGSKRKKCRKTGRVGGAAMQLRELRPCQDPVTLTSSQVQRLEKYEWKDGWKYGVVYICTGGSRSVVVFSMYVYCMLCVRACVYVWHVCVYVCVHARVCVCVCVRMCVCVYTIL